MSLQAYNAVWQHSTARGTDLLVLLALADFADEFGWSYPSIDALARKARISQRATQDRVRALAANRWIRVELQTGPNGTNRYQVLGLKATSTPQNLHPAESAPPQIRDGKRDGKRDEDLHPNRKESPGTVRNRTPKPSSAPSDPDAPTFEQFWIDYPTQANGTKPEKKLAGDQWLRLKPDERKRAFESLKHYKVHLRQSDQFCKHAFRYLKDRSFEDRLSSASAQGAIDDPDEQARRLVANAGL